MINLLIDRLNVYQYRAIYMTYKKVFSTNRFTSSHMAQESHIVDHCAGYALSDPKEDQFQHKCNHPHDQSCLSCEGLNSVLSSIEALLRDKAGSLADEEREDVMHSCQQAVQAIHNWKARQLRVLQQDRFFFLYFIGFYWFKLFTRIITDKTVVYNKLHRCSTG